MKLPTHLLPAGLVALALLLPGVRPIARRALTAVAARRLAGGSPFVAGGAGFPGGFSGGFGPQDPRDARRPGPATDGRVVRGDVVDP